MAANLETGREREVRYCGTTYKVTRGSEYGRKQLWQVWADGVLISPACPTRSKAIYRIHEHACSTGHYAPNYPDGLSYSQLVAALTR